MFSALRHFFYPCFCLWLISFSCSTGHNTVMITIEQMQSRGQLARADSLISAYLQEHPDITEQERDQLEFEQERNRRIRWDYRLTKPELFASLARRLRDVQSGEFERWIKQGRFDMLEIDGELRFVNPSVSNLLFRYPALRQRQKNISRESVTARLTFNQAQQLKTKFRIGGDAVTLPRRCRVTQTLRVKEGMVAQGERIRCWLPYPSVFATQTDVQLLSSSPRFGWIDHATSPIRSVYMDTLAGKQPQFQITYIYTAFAYYREIDPQRVLPFDGSEPEYRIYTREEFPHEVFSDKMRQLSNEIVGTEKNPYIKGKRIYNWIADNIQYSYAREYSTLRNISAYCLENKYGDCGQEAILFITLCRIAGVPARWQSGFLTFPGDEGMHDWAEIYIKPYGWIPVDPYMGIFFTSMTEDLTKSKRKEMRKFYYGNIDHYRLTANKGHNQILYPPKQHIRSETVDFQRGEVECNEHNLYFSDWFWSIRVEDVGEE